MNGNLDNRYLRAFSVTTDAFGIDPLLDKLVSFILKLQVYDLHDITQDERGAPDLISLNAYGMEDFWWHLMVYNGIVSFHELLEGTTIKLPMLGDLISLTTDNIIRTGSARIITI